MPSKAFHLVSSLPFIVVHVYFILFYFTYFVVYSVVVHDYIRGEERALQFMYILLKISGSENIEITRKLSAARIHSRFGSTRD